MRFAAFRLLAATACCATACCATACWMSGGCFLYTDPINRPPGKPEILRTAGSSRNMPFTFTARCNDPDGDRLLFSWARTTIDADHACPPAPTADMTPPPDFQGDVFTVMVTDLNPFCVWLRATDPSGAESGPVTSVVSPGNAPPVVVLTRQQPGGNQLAAFPLYSDFRFTAAGSSDPDGDPDLLQRSWDLRVFPDLFAKLQFKDHCALSEPADMVACFHADVPGSYQIALAVGDGTSTVESSETVTVAPDAPPCLIADGTASPARGANPAEARTFSATVADDGDPWPKVDPANEYPKFTWRLRDNKGAWQTATGYGAMLDLAAGQFSIGDDVEIRVEVADRVTRSLSACGDAATCELMGGCAQRVTWTVDFQ